MKLTDDFNRAIRLYRIWLTSPPFGRYGKRAKRREERREGAIDIYDLSTQPDRRKNDDDD